MGVMKFNYLSEVNQHIIPLAFNIKVNEKVRTIFDYMAVFFVGTVFLALFPFLAKTDDDEYITVWAF